MHPVISTTTRLLAASAALLAAVSGTAPVCVAGTQTTKPPLKHMQVNLNDRAALRNGAMFFMERCISCHSAQGTRFMELAKPLGLTPKQVNKYLNPTQRRVQETVESSMPGTLAKQFLGKAPPDLTVIARRRSADWLYTYLTSFYLDPSRPTGVNNVVFYKVAMPDVFAGLQGLQAPVMKSGYRFGKPTKVAVGVHSLTHGTMSAGQFDTMVRDIVTFLYYVGHPHQQERHAIGRWILGLLGLLTVLSFLLYKGYWRRVVPPQGGRWWRYWRK
ncbi:MAG TPA: cytochrome c1 [Gammaproteobacteria bacterium]|nr:cytochrome c1 [Gammaproteobacteria bacterium]